MVKLYVAKINNEEINPLTEKIWVIEDVPLLWREQVREALDEQTENIL